METDVKRNLFQQHPLNEETYDENGESNILVRIKCNLNYNHYIMARENGKIENARAQISIIIIIKEKYNSVGEVYIYSIVFT